jgi:hypothetical protein
MDPAFTEIALLLLTAVGLGGLGIAFAGTVGFAYYLTKGLRPCATGSVPGSWSWGGAHDAARALPCGELGITTRARFSSRSPRPWGRP